MRPGGPLPNVSPARKGWDNLGNIAERRRCGATCYLARHSFSNNYVHAIYSTKGRRDLISAEREAKLYSFVASLARKHAIPLLAAGGMADHSHFLFLLPATISLASVINLFKANSSCFMHQHDPKFARQNGYGAFSVSQSQLDEVTAYINNQREHHKKMTFEQEFLALLKKTGVAYDPQYVFG